MQKCLITLVSLIPVVIGCAIYASSADMSATETFGVILTGFGIHILFWSEQSR